MAWYGKEWFGMVRYGMMRYDMVWYDMICRVWYNGGGWAYPSVGDLSAKAVSSDAKLKDVNGEAT